MVSGIGKKPEDGDSKETGRKLTVNLPGKDAENQEAKVDVQKNSDVKVPASGSQETHQAKVPSEAKKVYEVEVMENCSTCAFSTWGIIEEKDDFDCRNANSPYHGQRFFQGMTRPKDCAPCWHPRGKYVIGKKLEGDAREPI